MREEPEGGGEEEGEMWLFANDRLHQGSLKNDNRVIVVMLIKSVLNMVGN